MNGSTPLTASVWFRRGAVALGCLLGVYAMVYVDLVLRARHAYNEGEKYMRWHAAPAEKKAFFDAELKAKLEALDKALADGKMDKDEHALKVELARFASDEAVKDSSVKYAYVWFQTAVELFSPPDSKYVVLSRARMAEAKELWRQELRAKKIPFEEYMLD